MKDKFELIQDIKWGAIFIPKGAILYEEQWCILIGRDVAAGIELEYSSDKKWWKKVD